MADILVMWRDVRFLSKFKVTRKDLESEGFLELQIIYTVMQDTSV